MNIVTPLTSIPPPINMLMNVIPFTYSYANAVTMPIPPPFYTTTTAIPHTTPYIYQSNIASPISGQHQVLVPPNPAHNYPSHMHAYSHPSHVPPLYFNHAPRPKFSFNPHPKLEKFNRTVPKGWINKAKKYIEFIAIDDGRKVKLARMHFEGKSSV